MTLTISRYQPSDLEEVVRVVNAAAQGDPLRLTDRESLRQQFEEPGVDIGTRGLVARTAAGQVVAFGRFRTRQKRADPIPIQEATVALDPAYIASAGPEFISCVWDVCREVSLQQGETGFIFQMRCDDTQSEMLRVLEALGMEYNRLLVTLELTSLAQVEPPAPVPGIEIRTARKGIDEQAWYHAYEDAFDDHWGQMVWPAALWEYATARPDYQPELNLIAWDTAQNEIAGFCYAKAHGTQGEFRWLGVRPRWRRRGLGDALTKAGLRALYAAGVTYIAMGADYESDTGPARVYERNGFRVIRRHLVYRREFKVI